MPYDAARSAFEAIAVDFSFGTEIAHRLSSQMNTTGRFHRPARLSASWKVPWLAAPSPKNATATESWPSFLYASAAPVAGGRLAPSMPLHEKFRSGRTGACGHPCRG